MSKRRPRLMQFAAAAVALDAAAALTVAVATPVLAQHGAPPAFPPFPETRSAPAIATWLRRNSDLPLTTVVGVGADSVFAVERRSDPAASPGVRAMIRQEAITPDFAKRLGGRSATMTVDIDCQGRRVFQRAVDLYTGSNRQGPSRQLGAAKDWQAIPAGTFMERVMVAVCDPAWRPPYSGDPMQTRVVIAPPPAQPQPAPVPAQPQPQPYPAPAPVYSPAPVPPPPPAPPSPRATPLVASARGTRAELGVYDSADAALSFWRAADLGAGGRRLRLELSASGGRTLYRAVVEGFSTHAEVLSFCRMVADLGADCAVVD